MQLLDIIELLGVAVSIIGIPLAYRLARRSLQKPELHYLTDFDSIVAEGSVLARGVAVTPDGHPIRAISRTRFAIWNHRGHPVKGSSILSSDPLCLRFGKSDRVLQVRIVSRSRSQNAFSATIKRNDPRCVLLSFAFLDANDGAVVEIIHQGRRPPVAKGTVVGVHLASRGLADLSPKALERQTERNLATRLYKYWLRDPSKRIEVFGLLVAAATFVGMGLTVAVSGEARSGELVAPADYDLNSVDGQRAFADRVGEIGRLDPSFSPLVWTLVAIGVLSVVAFGTMAWREMRTLLPSDVARGRVEPPARGRSGLAVPKAS